MDDQPQRAMPVAQVARVGIDLPCISCGYNLRSLPMSGRCPECNSLIEEALHHGWLVFADPQWLGRLRSGVTLILWTLLAAVICYFALVISVIVFFVPSGRPQDLGFLQWPMLLVGLGLCAAWLISVIRLTTPEPGDAVGERPRRGTLARWIVVLSTAPILSMLISGLSFDMMAGLPKLSFSNPWLVSRFVLSYAANLAGTIGFFLLLIVMRRIARRHTAKGLGKLMTALVWGSAALGVGWMAVSLAVAGMGFYAFSTGAVFPTTTSAPAGLVASRYTSAPIATSQWTTFFGIGVINDSTPPAGGPTTVPVASATNATTGPAAGRPTTGPATTMPAPPAVPPRPMIPTGGWMFLGLFLGLIFEFGNFGWMICGIVALFWFRSVLGRAIRQNAAGQPTIDA